MPAFLKSAVRHARKVRYDASFLAYPAGKPEYQLLAWIFGARERVGHAYAPASITNLLSLNTVRVPIAPTHNVLRNLDLLRSVGIKQDQEPRYLVPDAWKVRRQEPKLLAFHIGTVRHMGLEAKRWPETRFAQLAARMISHGHVVCFIAGPDEREETQRLIGRIPGVHMYEGALRDIARFLSRTAAVVTNDSGIGHLAAAVGSRVMALHGPTPVEGGPFGSRVVRFRPSTCPPCFDPRLRKMHCARDIDYACLKRDMTVESVHKRLMILLEAT